jgi:CRP-like cAMP-binding protein
MDRDYKRQLLSAHYLLGALQAKELEQVLIFATERSFPQGTTIFHKGDPGSSLMAVLRGRVRISSFAANGQEVMFTVVDRGGVFGELALMDGRERSASAVAMEDCTLLVIDRRDFLPFLKNNPEVAVRLIGVLCDYVRRISDTVEGLAVLDLPGRLARLLLRLSQSHGRPSEGGVRIDLKLSQADMGALVAASRESVNRLLRLWQDQELLGMSDGRITIRDAKGLSDYASGAAC